MNHHGQSDFPTIIPTIIARRVTEINQVLPRLCKNLVISHSAIERFIEKARAAIPL